MASDLPALLSMVEQDEVTQLQQHLCPSFTADMQVSRPGFWDKQWPQLVRHACEHVSENALRLLLMLKPTDDQAPPLPPLALGWILKGLEDHSTTKTFSALSPEVYDELVARLSVSPIALRTADGMRLVRMGGPSAALRQNKQDTATTSLFHAPPFQAAWQNWCASPTHRDQALPVLNAQHFFTTRLETMSALVDHLSPAERASCLNDLCALLDKKCTTRVYDSESTSMMIGWQGLFVREGWALDHPIWKAWGSRLCGALEKVVKAGTVSFSPIGDNWTIATLVQEGQPSSEPLPGWRWTPALRQGLVIERAHVVDRVISRHQDGQFISDTVLMRAGKFLHTLLQVEATMERWGMGDTATRLHLDTALNGVLEEGWETRFDQALPKDMAPGVHAHWAAWRARRLELDWDAASTPIALPGPRM